MKRSNIRDQKRKFKQKSVGTSTNLPDFCDFDCKFASFPEVDAVGACRREQGIFCTLFNRYNNKNNKCLDRIKQK